MKSYLGLIPIYERIHKRQSRMTRICIILAVFLVTSIFSMVEMWTKGEVESMRTSHGDWHIAVMNVSDDVIGTIRGDERIRSFALYEELNGDSDREFNKDPNKGYYIDGTDVELRSAEKSYFSDIMKYSLDGSFPEGDHEVALSSDAGDILGKEIGDKITVVKHACEDVSRTLYKHSTYKSEKQYGKDEHHALNAIAEILAYKLRKSGTVVTYAKHTA